MYVCFAVQAPHMDYTLGAVGDKPTHMDSQAVRGSLRRMSEKKKGAKTPDTSFYLFS